MASSAARIELGFASDFGDEDLLVVSAELAETWGSVLSLPPDRLAVVQLYAAGRLAIVDMLPRDGSTADATVGALMSLATSPHSKLYGGRVSAECTVNAFGGVL